MGGFATQNLFLGASPYPFLLVNELLKLPVLSYPIFFTSLYVMLAFSRKLSRVLFKN